MALVKRELKYRCYDDCMQSGCPSHVATLEFNSIVNTYEFKIGDKKYFLCEHDIKAMIDLIKSLNREDCVKLV